MDNRTLLLLFALALGLSSLTAPAKDKDKQVGDDLFTGDVPNLRIEIPPEGVETLRRYHQVWRQERPERIDVRATVREGQHVYKDVGIHLKGSFSFQPFDGKPSLTLHFDKFTPGQRFHGLSKIHLNNSVQDPTGLSEQFAREVFKAAGIPCPRAGPALVHVNGRNFGICVLVEGANKGFVERNFGSAKGNLYDGGSGGDVTKELKVVTGENPNDRSDIKELVDAANERDPGLRLERLKKVLDVDRFVTFAAIEALMVHWDGYCFGCNNYRVLHDTAHDKMVFIPHGMDQLFGVSNSTSFSLTPVFRGAVAKALFTVPEARLRYLERVEELSTKSLTVEALHEHLDRLAKRLRAALPEAQRSDWEDEVASFKARIADRAANVALQLKNPKRPVKFPESGVARLTNWTFKRDLARPAWAGRTLTDGKEILRVTSLGPRSTGSWRTRVFLDEGHYEFTGRARTQNVAEGTADEPMGVILRLSGDTATDGITISDDWKTLTYAFDVRGLEEVELVCELRAAGGVGEFDAGSMQLTRKGPAAKAAAKVDVPAPAKSAK